MDIIFTPTSEAAEKFLTPPTPATRHIPAWYKEMPLYINSDEKIPGLSQFNAQATNTTMKACTPFLDGLTFGYVWSSPTDIEIRKHINNDESTEYFFRWRTENDAVTEHTTDQHPTLPPVQGGEHYVLKWSFEFTIETPPGYSTLFTHPINRHDLPFRTFSGVVDTDKYVLSVQFPFQLITDNIKFPYIIEKGTPLCQIIPFKRDNWNSTKKEFSPENYEKRIFDFKSKIVRAYKSRYWTKKTFS